MQDTWLRAVQLQSPVSNMAIVLMTGYSWYSSLVVVFSWQMTWPYFLCASTPPGSAALSTSPVAAVRTHRFPVFRRCARMPPQSRRPNDPLPWPWRRPPTAGDPPARLGPPCCPPRQWARLYRPAASESRRAAVAPPPMRHPPAHEAHPLCMRICAVVEETVDERGLIQSNPIQSGHSCAQLAAATPYSAWWRRHERALQKMQQF